MADQKYNPRTDSVELFTPTKGGYETAGTHQATSAPEPAAPPPDQVPRSKKARPPIEKAAPIFPGHEPRAQPPKPPQPSKPPQPPKPPRPIQQAQRPVVAPPATKPAAPPQPVKKKKPLPTDAQGHGTLLAESMVTGFVDALHAQAAKRGGHLLPEDIEMLGKTFEKQSEKIASSISRSINVYAESHSQTQWDLERINAFDRILVKQFSHLLEDDEIAAKNPDAIPRRILSGVFVVVRMIAGPERIERYEQDAYLVMQRVRDDMKDDFTWDTVYDDPRVKHMLRDLLIFMAPHFIKLETRLEWLMGVINGNLSSVPPQSPVASWKLSPDSAFRIAEALFAEIRANVEDDLDRLKLTKQFGGEALDVILELHDGMTAHRARIFG